MSDARESPSEGEVPFKHEISRETFLSILQAKGATTIGRGVLYILWVAVPFAAIYSLFFASPGPLRVWADEPEAGAATQSIDLSRNSGTQTNIGVGNNGTQTNVGNTNNSINSSSGKGSNQSLNIIGGNFGSGANIRGGDVHNTTTNNTYNGLDLETIERLQRPDIDKLSPQQLLNRYIDPSSERVPDQPNVALHMLPIEGFEVTGLQDAASSALIDLGYHVPALFRKHFTSDGLDKELFRGSPMLAKRLRLKERCDVVLLGEVRLNAPNNLQNLFITEATMYLHRISVDSGAIVDDQVIRAKGSGLNANTSAASALRELEESLKQQLAEWTLI
jgi:hypothetical protein